MKRLNYTLLFVTCQNQVGSGKFIDDKHEANL